MTEVPTPLPEAVLAHRFGEFFTEGWTVERNGIALRQTLLGAQPAGRVVTETGAMYRDVMPGVDARIESESHRVEEYLTIAPGAVSQLIYEFRVESPNGSFRADERLQIVGADGHPVLCMTDVIHWRKNDEEVRRPETSVGFVDAKTARLTITLPVEDRAHEILLDPGWTTLTASLRTARQGHTATLLPDGKVLVAGGVSQLLQNSGSFKNTGLSSCEIYDPSTGRWSSTGRMGNVRACHQASVLLDGRVLVTGGRRADNSCEIYDPSAGRWAPTGPTAMRPGTATTLADGRVLAVCGYTAETYNPATGTWTSTSSPLNYRSGHTATLLSDGKVLVAGGLQNPMGRTSSCEVYDPVTGTWAATGSMTQSRSGHTAVYTAGKVFVYGTVGYDVPAAESYDPSTGLWSALPVYGVTDYNHTITSLGDGTVVVIGGHLSSACRRFDASTGAYVSFQSMLSGKRSCHASVLLKDGRVLITGGTRWTQWSVTESTDTCELYTP